MKDKINPVIITNPDDGQEYTLEFNRNSVVWAEQHGFDITSVQNGKYASFVGDVFFYSFRMHHPNVTRVQSDTILFDKNKGFGGVPDGLIERLVELYTETFNALIQDEESRKNSKWVITL